MPISDDEMAMRAIRRMGDRLVELGFAKGIRFQDATQLMTVIWTKKGKQFQKELKQIFDSVMIDSGQINMMEIQAMLVLFLKADEGNETVTQE